MEAQMQHPPPPHVSPKGMWVSKLILRILSIVFIIALAALGGSLANLGIVDNIFFLVVGPPIFSALAWDIAEIICILARGGHRGIHPGACVGVDLILWLGLVACITLAAILGLATSAMLYYPYYYGSYYDSYSSYGPDYGDSEITEVIEKGRAILGLTATLTLVHFVLFVIACYETNVRNTTPRTTYVVYTTTTNAPGQPAPTFTGVPSMIQQPGQVYYQPGQPGQMPMYYTYAPSPQTNPQSSPTVSTATSPMPQDATLANTYAIQPNPAPPVYSGRNMKTGADINKTELPS